MRRYTTTDELQFKPRVKALDSEVADTKSSCRGCNPPQQVGKYLTGRHAPHYPLPALHDDSREPSVIVHQYSDAELDAAFRYYLHSLYH